MPDFGPMAYYRGDLARVHHLGFGFHADLCAPGILKLLEPIRGRRGVVVEVGCGSGLLTRHLLDAGHRVIATDASPAMLDLARQYVPDAEAIERVVLPDDPLPSGDAVVSVGHVLSYLPDEDSLRRGLVVAARAVRPGGTLALDICDLEWAEARTASPDRGWVSEDWALVTRFSIPSPERFVREMAIFSRNEDGSWRRDDERHDNVLVDTATLPSVLADEGIEATMGVSFGQEQLPQGLRVILGHRPPA